MLCNVLSLLQDVYYDNNNIYNQLHEQLVQQPTRRERNQNEQQRHINSNPTAVLSSEFELKQD